MYITKATRKIHGIETGVGNAGSLSVFLLQLLHLWFSYATMSVSVCDESALAHYS